MFGPRSAASRPLTSHKAASRPNPRKWGRSFLNLQRPTKNTTRLFSPRYFCTTRTTLLPRALRPVVKQLSYCHTHESLNPSAPAVQLGRSTGGAALGLGEADTKELQW